MAETKTTLHIPNAAGPNRMALDESALKALSGITTATLTTVLHKKGLRNIWLRGPKPLRSGQPRLVGLAFTLRFIPAREDLSTPESWASPVSTRAAIEAMPPGCVAVADAMGVSDAGIFGDILCQRIQVRGVAGLVTDGVVRDLAGVLQTGLPVWCTGAAAPASIAGLTFINWQEPIACGGVAIFPGDIIVADDDGAVVIPQALLPEVAEAGVEQEKFEAWIIDEVKAGTPLPGLYPPNAETKSRYEAFRKGNSKAAKLVAKSGAKQR
jgi:regulator of RNase E activity RraA